MAQRELLGSLQNGMHALAQPLTLLRSYFYLAGQGPIAVPAAHPVPALLADATAAMEDLCTLFRLMQELLYVQSSAARVEVVAVSFLLQSFAEDAEAVFAGTGLRFVVECGEGCALASQSSQDAKPASLSVDYARIRGALASMLRIASESSERGSIVSCRVTRQGSGLTLLIEPAPLLAAAPRQPSSEAARLHLALVQANIAGQQVEFATVAEPWSLSLKLLMATLPA